MSGLEALGVSAVAEQIYRQLCANPMTRLADLRVRTQMETATLLAILEELTSLGLAAPVADGWRALPLLAALPTLRARRLEDITRAVTAAEVLQTQLYAAQEQDPDVIETVVGRDAMLRTRTTLCARAAVRIDVFDRPPYAAPLQGPAIRQASPEYHALVRGIPVRTVYHPGFDSARLSSLQEFVAAGEQARIASVPMKLIIVDSRVAFIPSIASYEYGSELQLCVVRHPIMVDALVSLFASVWDTAVPLSTTTSAPRHEGLVALLMTGATDAVIAHKLGVTERSVRRWVADLMERYGVRTRLQLGAALARRDGDEK